MDFFRFSSKWVWILILMAGCSKRPHTQLSSSDSIVIEPKTAFGPLHAGMSVRQIIDEIGKPDRKKEGLLAYNNLGFLVVVKNDQMRAILCYRSAGSPGGMKTFNGRTSRGIRLGASRAEVIQAYGNPEKIDKFPSMPTDEVLRYIKLGLVFFMHGGSVDSMDVVF